MESGFLRAQAIESDVKLSVGLAKARYLNEIRPSHFSLGGFTTTQ